MDLPICLREMSPQSRGLLIEDIARWGEEVQGLSYKRVLEHTGLGAGRAERLHAWLHRYGLEAPSAAPTREPEVEGNALSNWDARADSFDRVPIPEDQEAEQPIEELIEEKCRIFERARARHATTGPRQIRMPPGPFAIAHFGDPHVDDDGCDWPALRRDVQIVQRTEGMYAGNVGDSTNNWVGRLTELYGDQRATRDDGYRLAKWLLEAVPWLYVVMGNHDLWNQGAPLLKEMVSNAKIGLMAADDVKLELLSPGGEPCRIHVRHDFPGHSMWNAAHSNMRASKLDGWAHLYVAGHRHEWVEHREECTDGVVRTCIRARGYKRFDKYARSKGFHEQAHGATVVTVHDPRHRHPAERIQVYLDVAEAAEVLTWKRARWAKEAA